MKVIQHSEVLPGSPEALFDLSQDYSVRLRWDPFPDSYRFLPPFVGPEPGAILVVRARNGQSMTVRYVSYNRPRAAAFDMVSGPWFISKCTGAWSFKALPGGMTRVSFKYRIVAGPRPLAWLIQPLLSRSFLRHARKRLAALHAYVVANAAERGV